LTLDERWPSTYDSPVTSLSTCLWFDGNADEAVDFYTSIFPNSRRISSSDYGPDMPYEEGTTLVVNFELDGRPFMALNAGPEYHFTPAISLVIGCATQEEVDFYWDHLVERGNAVQCGWLAGGPIRTLLAGRPESPQRIVEWARPRSRQSGHASDDANDQAGHRPA